MRYKVENAGQIVHGSVHAETLVLNIGGQPRPLYEIDEFQLGQLRRRIIKAITFRTRQNHFITVGSAALLFWLLSLIPDAVRRVPGMSESTVILGLGGAVLGTVLAVWSVRQARFGPLLRRNRAVIEELEEVLARLDAELDMRKPLEQLGNMALMKALFSGMAER